MICHWRASRGPGRCVTLLCLVLGLATPLLAHHSFAMFDTTIRITVTGKVAVFEWTNPHVVIEIDGAEEDGGLKHWTVELGSPGLVEPREPAVGVPGRASEGEQPVTLGLEPACVRGGGEPVHQRLPYVSPTLYVATPSVESLCP